MCSIRRKRERQISWIIDHDQAAPVKKTRCSHQTSGFWPHEPHTYRLAKIQPGVLNIYQKAVSFNQSHKSARKTYFDMESRLASTDIPPHFRDEIQTCHENPLACVSSTGSVSFSQELISALHGPTGMVAWFGEWFEPSTRQSYPISLPVVSRMLDEIYEREGSSDCNLWFERVGSNQSDDPSRKVYDGLPTSCRLRFLRSAHVGSACSRTFARGTCVLVKRYPSSCDVMCLVCV